jgi:hypothetical protein
VFVFVSLDLLLSAVEQQTKKKDRNKERREKKEKNYSDSSRAHDGPLFLQKKTKLRRTRIKTVQLFVVYQENKSSL